MSEVLLFGGTSEGRLIAELLDSCGVSCMVSVATEYGESLVEETDFVKVRKGRLSPVEMKELMISCGCKAVVDATHPYAVEVSANIRKSGEGLLPVIRYQRQVSCEERTSTVDGGADCCVYFKDSASCRDALLNTEGKILLTTGSKELGVFAASPELRDRLVVRVLPGLESLKLCYDAGLTGKQIIAMQGPFSKDMNIVQLKDYGINILVTKESGKAGGADEKMDAARTAGVQCFVIQKPEEICVPADCVSAACASAADGEDQGSAEVKDGSPWGNGSYRVVSDAGALCSCLGQILGKEIQFHTELKVTLAGLGPGAADSMTVAVQKCIKDADVVFGAPRMLEGLSYGGKCFPFYLAADIIPRLEELRCRSLSAIKAVVLFSGDTGFYSGASRLKEALQKLPRTEVQVLPGISSMQCLAARFGRNWQNAAVISLHGVKEQYWLPELTGFLKDGRDVFFLTSGPADVARLGEIAVSLVSSGAISDYEMLLGHQLSYGNEKIYRLKPAECSSIVEPGLYCGFLVPVSTSENRGNIENGING